MCFLQRPLHVSIQEGQADAWSELLCQKVMWYSGVQGRTSLLFGGSNKIGPLGIVVIVVVVICLATSAWLCFMMHMRVKRKYSNNLHRKVCWPRVFCSTGKPCDMMCDWYMFQALSDAYLSVMQLVEACAVPSPSHCIIAQFSWRGLLCAVWPETKQDVWTWHISVNDRNIFKACSDWAPAVKERAFGRGWAQ